MTASTTTETRFRVGGMDCASCAAKIDTAVRRLPQVSDVSVSVAAGTLRVSHTGGGATESAIANEVTALGYTLAPLSGADRHQATSENRRDHGVPAQGRWWRGGKARLTIVCGLALITAFMLAWLVPRAGAWPYVAAMAVGLVPIAQRARAAARAGTPFSIETLMTIAAVGAVLIGASEEAAVVIFLFLVGELLEGVAASRARASIEALTALVPTTALRVTGAGTSEVPATTLAIGDVIRVRPGDRIAADGVLVSGETSVDEAPVTGESTPLSKRPGEPVYAGTINLDGAIEVRVTAVASDNTITRIVRLVEEAQEAKAPTQRFIDRFSRYYTPGVLALGALVAVMPPLLGGGDWGAWIYKGLAILLIGCLCALVISTPAAIAAGLTVGARRGLLIKGGAALETLGRITLAAFDKTGTLTEGRPQVTDIVAVDRSETEVLRLAAALETGSNHPLAKSILARAVQQALALPPVAMATAVNGKGVTGTVDGHQLFLGSAPAAEALTSDVAAHGATIKTLQGEGKTVAVLLADGRLAGVLAMRDEPRADAKAGLDALKARGIATLMLTGDNAQTAQAIAKKLGIEALAELLPADKQRIVDERRRAGAIVAKIGDGINDAPALAAADVGIAMGGGTDVALETGDAAALHGRVGDIPAMVDLSRSTMANIRQNIAVALGLKALFLVTTIAGMTGLWPAILADTGATVLVTMNALRLLALGRSSTL